MQRVRANLYATLLYYMRMIQRTDSLKEHGKVHIIECHMATRKYEHLFQIVMFLVYKKSTSKSSF